MSRKIDLTGQKFGRLLVLRCVDNTTSKAVLWECLCECGKICTVKGILLRRENTKSCGCLRREIMRQVAATRNLRHGEGSNGKETPEYRAWSNMLSRCNNNKHQLFGDYGGRGVKVCERWHVYENFIFDMGRRPSRKHSLDRIDNNKNYMPENCRWATMVQQNNNQRPRRKRKEYNITDFVNYAGKTQTVLAWMKELARNPDTYRARRRAGMSIEEALFTPLQPPGRKPCVRT